MGRKELIVMNKNAIIKTQLMRQLKAIGLFLILYAIIIGGLLVVNEYQSLSLNFSYVSDIFVIYLVIASWIVVSKSLVFYTYHSYSRQTILSRTVIVQLIVSFIASALMEGHNWLLQMIPGITNNETIETVKNVYAIQLSSNEVIRSVIACLMTTLGIFSLLQFTNLILIASRKIKRRTLIISLVVFIVVASGLVFSLPYWNNTMLGLGIKVFGFVFGTGQDFVPAIVIPVVILVVIAVASLLATRRLIKKLEIYRNVFI